MTNKQEIKKTNFELIVELIKAIIWPLMVIVLLCIFWQPVNAIVNKLPPLVEKTKKLTIGSLTLEINEEISANPTEEVKNVLLNLKPGDIESILSNPGISNSNGESAKINKEQYKNLIELKVFEVCKSESDFCVQQTKLGQDTRNFLMEIVKKFSFQHKE